LGLGAGSHPPEYAAFGYPYDHLAGRFEEALSIIVPLLREGRVDFAGRYYAARECELAPPYPKPGGPPILIGAGGPRMLRLAARYGDMWNTGYCSDAASFQPLKIKFEEARADMGDKAAGVELTAILKVGWSDLGELPDFFGDDYLTGSAQDIAATWNGFAAA